MREPRTLLDFAHAEDEPVCPICGRIKSPWHDEDQHEQTEPN